MDAILTGIFAVGLFIAILGWGGLASEGLNYWWLTYRAKITTSSKFGLEYIAEQAAVRAFITYQKEQSKSRLKLFGWLMVIGWTAMALVRGYYLFLLLVASK